MTDNSKVQKIARTVRTLSIDGVQKANSGHPGLPLGAADFATLLWAEELRFCPTDPEWPNRDRFVLSAGHGSMLLYSLLHLFGYALPMSELQRFRQWESKTPGHPEFGFTPGVEATTGPLGQGAANSVGLALSAKLLASSYGADLFNYRVFALVSDGDLMEGVSAEAGSLAGHLGLDNLIYFYDDNQISLAGETKICFTESVADRYKAYGWHVERCDGHDLDAIRGALKSALSVKGKPKLICCRTTIGFGSPNKKHTHDVHGSPLGAEELKLTKQALGADPEKDFDVPADVRALCSQIVEARSTEYAKWKESLAAWRAGNPEKGAALDAQLTRTIPAVLRSDLEKAFAEGKKDATRNLSGAAIQVISKHLPNFIGGSADLDPSTKTAIKGSAGVQSPEFSGRNLHFGVREHAMGSLVNGLAYTGAWIPYSATFLVFSDYMRPPMRLAALSHLQSLFLFTHDSFWVGEDGPTHEPIEQIMSLRLMPGMHVYRPADGLEVALCYWAALNRRKGPSTLIFTRQNVTPLTRPASFSSDDILKGGYIVSDDPQAKVVLVATGSEVNVAVDAAKELSSAGVAARVVSMPCVEAFREQPKAYVDSVLGSLPRVTIEAGCTTGWASIVGGEVLSLGIDHYGASAPGEELAERFGFSGKIVAEKVKSWMASRG